MVGCGKTTELTTGTEDGHHLTRADMASDVIQNSLILHTLFSTTTKCFGKHRATASGDDVRQPIPGYSNARPADVVLAFPSGLLAKEAPQQQSECQKDEGSHYGEPCDYPSAEALAFRRLHTRIPTTGIDDTLADALSEGAAVKRESCASKEGL